MPLEPGSGRDVIERNIHEMVASGHPVKQAVAASLRNANYKRKGFAFGGFAGLPNLGSIAGGGMNFGNVGGAGPGGGVSAPPMTGGLDTTAAQAFGMPAPGSAFNNSWASRGTQQPQPPGGAGGNMHMPTQPTVTSPSSLQPYGHMAPLPPTSKMSMARADGGMVPWFARNEARSMVHTGPIHSIVAGRTDHIPMKVAGGSYVLPADYVSHLGQNNTTAGHAKANLMFGHTGPFGSTIPKVAHGRGAPAPPVPRPPSSSRSNAKIKTPFSAAGGKTFEGGVEGEEPIDIMAAGGEFVIHPDVVRQIGGGNIDHGHKILDRHVLAVRQKHKKTLAKLPPPAK